MEEQLENEQMEEKVDNEMVEEQLENVLMEKQPPPAIVEEEPPQIQDDPVSSEKKELSKARRIWRTFLIWLTVIALSFLAGVLTLNYIRYKPALKELTQVYQDVANLETQVSNLSAQLGSAADTADSLQGADTHREFLQVQLDISNARLALVNGDVTAARAALTGTTLRLEGLVSEIQQVDAGLADSLPKRLSLVISGLEDNLNNATVDLGLLASDLQDLIKIIYGE